ncbi:sugar kinase [candidate division KSB1 bacterium]|nr:sugar kinase [candidate division KSB1 bacterium]
MSTTNPKRSPAAARPVAPSAVTPDLVVVGSVAQDIIHTPYASTDRVLGGAATHFANAASFFARVGIVGVVGEDFPHAALDFLRKRRADLSGIHVAAGESFLWEGRYLEHFLKRETIRTELGVFADFRPELPEHFLRPKILFLAAINPDLQLAVLRQVERPKLVAIDTFQLWIDVARKDLLKVLKQSDLFIANDDEVRWLTGEHNLFKGAEALRKLGPKWVIVKKGEHGSFFVGEHTLFLSNTYPVREIVDPTGAGDAYAGGVLGYLAQQGALNEKQIARSMGWGSVVGSFYVEGFGPDGLRTKTMRELNARYKAFVKLCAIP